MKFQAGLSLLTALTGASHAIAIENGVAVAAQSAPRSDVLTGDLERRFECDILDKVFSNIGTSSGVAVYATVGGVTANAVCKLSGKAGPDACRDFATAVGGVMFLVIAPLYRPGDSAARPASDKRSIMLSDSLEAYFQAHDTQYHSISTIPVADHDGIGPRMLDHAHVKNWQHGDTTWDLHVADFGEGQRHVRISLPSGDSNSTVFSPHTRRAANDHPGFKISFTERIASKLTTAHKHNVADSTASYWETLADRSNLANLMGLQKTDHNANYYWRIIPEDRGYGLNYESVGHLRRNGWLPLVCHLMEAETERFDWMRPRIQLRSRVRI